MQCFSQVMAVQRLFIMCLALHLSKMQDMKDFESAMQKNANQMQENYRISVQRADHLTNKFANFSDFVTNVVGPKTQRKVFKLQPSDNILMRIALTPGATASKQQTMLKYRQQPVHEITPKLQYFINFDFNNYRNPKTMGNQELPKISAKSRNTHGNGFERTANAEDHKNYALQQAVGENGRHRNRKFYNYFPLKSED